MCVCLGVRICSSTKRVLVETPSGGMPSLLVPSGGIAWEDASCGCLRNMETDSLLMLSEDSLRGLWFDLEETEP
ncbi:hypothetical protein CEXT_328971 [Caerostris extrusa]|uniref:Uncharacterized protein n=1 Tax=Caerostris extrusa TaxID=172846 RepID=A0AAV4QXM4_CAEEX|nr:hypothetical protein CEXT_328971 [Caerostris extrusa]